MRSGLSPETALVLHCVAHDFRITILSPLMHVSACVLLYLRSNGSLHNVILEFLSHLNLYIFV